MCTPAAAMAATTMISAGARMASEAQQASHESKELEREAKVARAQGAEEERRLRAEAARSQAKRRVAILKGGVTTEGSPTDMLLDAAREDEAEARWARFGRRESARAQEREARNRRRRSVLDQLSSTQALGTDLIRLGN
ncbi:MAG: hypothetical protein IPK59_11965 [Rhodospirillaceae bacterium]|nr:hypothetical protein [Rhodospirillaceae bacterium]